MLVTLLEIKEFLKIKLDNDSEDDRISSINTYVSSLIESYCGRTIRANSHTEYFNGGVASVFIKNPPILSVHEVSHFNGESYTMLGGPGAHGQQVVVEGSSHSVGFSSNAKTTTRVKKYGTSSLLLDGASNISIGSSEDFDFEGEPFTVEAYFRSKDLADAALISRSDDEDNYWELAYNNSTGIYFKTVEGGVETNYAEGTTISANTFTHIAVVKSDSDIKIFKDGIQAGTALPTSNAVPTLSSSLDIGRINQTDKKYFNGHIDELRISWIDRYSSNFSENLSTLSSDEDTKLLLHFNDGNNKRATQDYSRAVNEYVWYADSGEVSFDTGLNSGTPKLGFFNPTKAYNYTNGVKVSYRGGYATVPSDMKLAALEMIKVLYKGREGAKSVRLQGDDSTSHDLAVDGFPPQVRRVLNLYRIPF